MNRAVGYAGCHRDRCFQTAHKALGFLCIMDDDFEKEQCFTQLDFTSTGNAGVHNQNNVALKYKELSCPLGVISALKL